MTPFVFQIAPHINFKFFDKSNSHLRLEDIGKQTDDGAPPVPSNFTTITPLVMTPHCHAPSCIRHYLPLEVKGATGPLGFMTLSFTPFGRSSHVTHQYLVFFTDGKKPRQRYFAFIHYHESDHNHHTWCQARVLERRHWRDHLQYDGGLWR